jgi:hypothetical protein
MQTFCKYTQFPSTKLLLISTSQVCNDGSDFGNSFGQIVSLRQDAHHLAAAVIYELSAQYSLILNASIGINTDGFLGIHLRTATDAVKVMPPCS